MSLVQLHHCVNAALDRSHVVHRRDFLRGISAAGLAAGTLSWTDLMTAQADELRRRGMACILLWMQGGPSQFETFSPKPGHANGGETKAIPTSVPGIEIAENFPEMAKAMDRAAIIRSMTSKEGSHPRATFLLHTGYLPTAAVKYPSLGSIVAHEIADAASQLPSFVRVSGRGQNSSGGGFLGVKYDPFDIQNPSLPPNNTRPTTELARYERRLDLLGRLQADFASAAPQEVGDHKQLYERATKMITSPEMKAFDLAQESDAMRTAYGESAFGAGCLLARRLVESGVTFVEVASNGWDTHADNFNRSKQLAEQVDRPFAQLIQDLRDRGMLDRTLIVWMGEFGRTPNINARGGRDHYPRAFNVALAGGGIRGGQVIGKTDEAGTAVTDRPVTVTDLFQTICAALKIDGNKENHTGAGRPIKIVDGGDVVRELLT
ncbi:MAG: DUF1501 domain-containing protein [Pirellulales bacterium]